MVGWACFLAISLLEYLIEKPISLPHLTNFLSDFYFAVPFCWRYSLNWSDSKAAWPVHSSRARQSELPGSER